MAAEQAAAKWAGDEDRVADLSARTSHRAAHGGLAEQRDGDHERAVPGVGVAADERDAEPIGHPNEAAMQFPRDLGRAAVLFRQRDCDHRRQRPRGHRRDVGEIHAHRLAADSLRARIIEPEMAAIHQHIGRHDKLDSRRRFEQRRVIADAEDDRAGGCLGARGTSG